MYSLFNFYFFIAVSHHKIFLSLRASCLNDLEEGGHENGWLVSLLQSVVPCQLFTGLHCIKLTVVLNAKGEEFTNSVEDKVLWLSKLKMKIWGREGWLYKQLRQNNFALVDGSSMHIFWSSSFLAFG